MTRQNKLNDIDNLNYEKYMKEVFMNTLWTEFDSKLFKKANNR